MKLGVPAWTQSIRFRLTLTYSIALYVIGALVLGAIYLGLANSLDDDAVTRTVVAQGFIPQPDGGIQVQVQQFEAEFRSFESLSNERALEQLRRWSFGALAAMFFVSLVVGWFVAGRVVRPVARITDVARDIQATDLSRRIDLHGPDDELTRLAGTFDDMLGRLDRAFESQRRFVHEASHELRNPLATIRTNLEVALADPDATASDLRQTAEVIDRTTERMGTVVDDLVSFVRREMPEREATLVDLAELVGDLCEEFAGTAEAANVEIGAEGSSAHMVRADPSELRRVFANLVANAIEHAPSGTDVRVAVFDTPATTVVTVADRGPGVSDVDREHVFQRGWRGSTTRELRPGGSGLGLPIARQLVEANGGSIQLDNGAGVGARFTVELPAAPAVGLGR